MLFRAQQALKVSTNLAELAGAAQQTTSANQARPLLRHRLARIADGFAIAVAVALPWSISQTEFLLLIWLLVLVPTLDRAELWQEIKTAAGGLPIVLFVLAAFGMAWADVSWSERLGGLDSFIKLLIIPLLLCQFRRSEIGWAVMVGYLASCLALLAIALPTMAWQWNASEFTHDFGVPVKNVGTQNAEFVCCCFGLLFPALEKYRRGRPKLAAGMLVPAVLFLASSFYLALVHAAVAIIVLGALVTSPILLVVLSFKKLSRVRALGLLGAGAIMCGLLCLYAPPQPRDLASKAWDIIQTQPETKQGWEESLPEFWKSSLNIIADAPILGHGTGSIHKLLAGSGWETTNPLQQTFAVGLQIGVIGICVLWAMWLSHLLLFRGSSLPAWIGLVVVIQNIVGSLFDSQLFDSTLGWTYAFGVGVAGGMVRQLRADAAPAPQLPAHECPSMMIYILALVVSAQIGVIAALVWHFVL
jgi:O-antigen ligase